MTDQTPPHVVIVGAGFGGMETARRLATAPVRITLIDRQNYHLFQPLLYQVAIAGLVPSQIAYPIRTIFRRQKNLAFRMGEVTAVDFSARFVKMDGSVTAYDYLVLAITRHPDPLVRAWAVRISARCAGGVTGRRRAGSRSRRSCGADRM